MPHITIEYSANLRASLGLTELISAMHETAIGTGVFPPGGTRTRAAERSDYKIADGHPDNGFVHVLVKIGHGRDLPTRQAAGEALFKTLTSHLGVLYERSPLAISLEMQEIDPVLTYKQNNIHDHLKRRKT